MQITLTMSCWGNPSVMHTMRAISAFIASMMAAAAKGGGTYITEQSGWTPSTASWTESKTGSPRCNDPPFLGVTPPTILVPYAIAC